MSASYIRMESMNLMKLCESVFDWAKKYRAKEREKFIKWIMYEHNEKPRRLERWRKPRSMITREQAITHIEKKIAEERADLWSSRSFSNNYPDDSFEYNCEKLAKKLLKLAQAESFVYVTAEDMSSL